MSRSLRMESLENRRVFAGLVINELVSDPANVTGTNDQPFEFIEIKGIPGSTISNVYFLSVEGDGGAAGLADISVDLTGRQIGSNGLLVIKATGAANGHPAVAGTTYVELSELDDATGQTFENGSNSFMLVSSPTPIAAGTDFDTDNDGVLELFPGAVVLDAFGWLDGQAGDRAYGAVLSQTAGSPPGGATRFLHDNRPTTVDAWYFGDLQTPNSSTLYTATVANRSANFPVGGALTPGDVNVPGDPNVAPVGIADLYQVTPGGTLSVNAGSGVLSNDTDANGVTSSLAARLVTPPANATSFTLNADGSFSYVNNGTPGLVTFTYEATDLSLFSSAVTVSINVANNTNVSPTIAASSGPLAYAENAVNLVLASTATVTDPDSVDFGTGSLTVDVTANASADDRLSVRNEGTGAGQIGVTGTVVQFGGVTIGSLAGGDGANPLVISLNSNASVAAVQALMRNVTFGNISETPSELQREVRFVANDGDGGAGGGLSNSVTVTVNVSAVNDAPGLFANRPAFTYAAGGPAVTLDGLITVTDIDSVDFNTGVLTATISAGAVTGDSLFVRNNGFGPNQVAVTGANVSVGGVNVGTIAGGTAGVPLTVTFNSAATPAVAQTVARSIAFQTTSPRLTPAPRTIAITTTDGDGGTSNTSSYTVTQSQVRRFGFQEGVDNGQGVYVGTSDTALAQAQPDNNLTSGANAEGLLIDYDAATANSAVLVRFDNIIGSGAGQVPANAQIVAARLVVDTNNPGDGGSFHRMLGTWDQTTATWNSIPTTTSPGGTPVRNNGVSARASSDSQVGDAAGGGPTGQGSTIMGVKADIQAWLSGEANHGWLMQGWEGEADGWAFSPSEAAVLQDRPRLEIDWIPATITSASFQQGLNGYTGTVDTALTEATPDVDNSAGTGMMFVDFNQVGVANNVHVVMRFDQINGTTAGQIPAGALVHNASLTLSSSGGNGSGDGGRFFSLLQPFAAVPTWNGFVSGIQNDGIEAAVNPTVTAGNANRVPNVEGGWHTYDVSSDVQAWTNGTANHGWGIVPWDLGSDGWGIFPSEAIDQRNRPQLQVFFTPVGVTVTPTSGLTTTEAGGTASFTVALDTPPTADVTIGLTSNDTTEGNVGVSQLVFTPTNWDIPQTVVVTGVDDAAVDGNIAYQIVTAAATSSDPNYNGLAVADVSLTNTDNDTGGGIAPKIEGVPVFGDGTAQRSMIRRIQVNFDSAVNIAPGAFVLERGGSAGFNAIPASDLTITVNPTLVAGKTVAELTFSSPTPSTFITGGSLPDGNYRLTIQSNLVTAGGLNLDGDGNGVAGGNYIRGTAETDNFFRRFGDGNGNRTATLAELGQLRAAINKASPDPGYDARYDFNSNGVVSLAELGQLRARINARLDF